MNALDREAWRTRHAVRNASLDTLRGLAILLVLIGHYAGMAPYELAGYPIRIWFQDFGHGGVLLFFMLSGYLIWTKGHENPAPTFLLRRFAKIAPAYWINVLFVALAGMAMPIFPGFSMIDTLGNLAFLEGAFGITPLSGVYWTLVVEVKFYLLFTIMFYSPLRRLFWLVPVFALGANLAALAYAGRSSTFLVYLPVFFAGAAFAASERDPSARSMYPLIVAISIAGLCLAAPHRGWQAGLFLAIDACAFWVAYRNGMASRWLAWLGLVSYSVYLYHTTLGYPLLEAFGPAAGSLWPLLLAAVVLSVIGISWLSYRHVERVFVLLARKFEPVRSETPESKSL